MQLPVKTVEKLLKIKGSWKEGGWLDRWSEVHFFVGVLAGFGPVLLKMTFLNAAIIFVPSVIAWELFEWLIGIEEKFENKISDVVIAIFGFLVIYPSVKVLTNIGHTPSPLMTYFVFSTILVYTTSLAFEGWKAYKFKKEIRKTL